MRRMLIFLMFISILLGCSKDEWRGIATIEDGVKIVHNPDEGIWDRNERGKKLKLTPELSIGTLDGDENELLHRVTSVIADDDGNIYICELIDGQIKKFDENGNYLMTMGRNGSGPGELARPGSMTFDPEGHLCVVNGGNNRIEKFTKEGNYFNSVPIRFGSGNPGGIAIDKNGTIYISYWDQDTDKTIHKYKADGTYVSSFGHSVEYPEPHGMVSMMHKRNFANGLLMITDSSIIYSQTNPFEICEFSKDGSLKMKILREAKWMPKAKAEYGENESVKYRLPSRSIFLALWNEYIINNVLVAPYVTEDIGSVIDLFDMEGRLLHSLKLKERIWLHHLDGNGKLYCWVYDKDEFEKVVRYRLSF